jgi:hypothetical protein
VPPSHPESAHAPSASLSKSSGGYAAERLAHHAASIELSTPPGRSCSVASQSWTSGAVASYPVASHRGTKRPYRDRDLVRDRPYRRTPLRSAARPVLLRDGHARPSLRLATAPKRARQGPRPSVWRPADDVWLPADDPVRIERHSQPSDSSNDIYRPNRWLALCPGCGPVRSCRSSRMVRIMREAAERGEAVLYI